MNKKRIKYYILTLLLFLVGITNVSAADIDSANYLTKFYYYDTSNSVAKSTDYKSSNEVTMNSTSDNSSGSPGQFFTGFYSQITGLKLSANTQYVFTIKLTYNGLYYEEIAGSYISRLASNTYTKSIATINNVVSSYKLNCPASGSSTTPCSVDITLTYTITPTSALTTLYLGSYSTSNYNMGFQNHVEDVYVVINSISYQDKVDDTLINQNQTIIDQNNQTNEELGNLNDKIEDTDIQGSLDGAGGFFGSFSSPDHGGLSGIITAPLTAINQMLNTTCNPMTATFKGKDLSLPCGYDFWDRLGAIQDFINVVLGGMLCYRIIIKLYKLIEKIKNPEDDRLEVMDL